MGSIELCKEPPWLNLVARQVGHMVCRKPWLVWVTVEDPREPEGKQAVGGRGGGNFLFGNSTGGHLQHSVQELRRNLERCWRVLVLESVSHGRTIVVKQILGLLLHWLWNNLRYHCESERAACNLCHRLS
jgi:hypothetical protein